MRRLACGWILVAFLVSAPASARPDVLDDLTSEETRDFVKTAGERAFKRTRRSLTLGPMIGAAPGLSLDGGDLDAQLSFGLGLLRYDIPPVPTPARIKEILEDRVKTLVKERVEAAVARGEKPSEEQIRRWARESWEAVKGELLLELQPAKFESPSFNLRVEGDYLLEAGAWNLRAVVGLGVGPVYVNVGTGLQVDDGAAGLASAGLSVPMLLSDGTNSPVVHFYLRADIPYTDRDERDDRIFLGAQFLLDVI